MFMRTFAKSVLVITAFALCTRIIGFVFRIFLSRILGAEMLGVYQMSMSIFMVLLTVISSGLPLVMSREVAKAEKDSAKIFNLTVAGLIIGVVASVLLCLIVLACQSLLGWVFTDERSIAILLAMLPAIIASSIYCVLRAIWWGEKRFFLLGLTELIEQVARVILFVLLLGFTFYFANLAHLAAWSFTGACIVSAIIVIIIFCKTNKLSRQERRKENLIRPLLKSAAPITGVRFISSMAFPIISVLLPLRLVAAGWSNVAAISHYGIIVGMTFPLLTIPSTVISALATALVPELSTMAADQNWPQVRAQVRTVLKFTIFVNFIFIPIYLALGTGIGDFLYGDVSSGIYLARSAWTMVPLSLSQITNTTLNSLGKEGVAMRNYFLGSLILFAAIWFLPAVLGADAVLLGLGLSMSLSTILNILAIRKYTLWQTSDKTLATITAYTILCLPVLAIGYFSYQLCAALPLFFSLAIAGSLTCGAFFVLTWATNLIILPKKRQ